MSRLAIWDIVGGSERWGDGGEEEEEEEEEDTDGSTPPLTLLAFLPVGLGR